MHPYHRFVSETARLVRDARHLPLGGLPFTPRPALATDAPRVLIFSPHPDDECIVGALALRLLRQAKMRIVDVAVTQGSNKERQAGRLAELRGACAFLGFEVLTTAPGGLERISAATRTADPEHWHAAVSVIADILARERPRVVFCPHEADSNSTHIGTHFLVMDALKNLPANFECAVIETEFWGQMASPNLMIELSVADVADLLAGLSFHAGEVRRNPFHLRMPAWLQDNVRRGAELVCGQGGAAPDFTFATLYRLRQWKNGRLENVFEGGKEISAAENPGGILHLVH